MKQKRLLCDGLHFSRQVIPKPLASSFYGPGYIYVYIYMFGPSWPFSSGFVFMLGIGHVLRCFQNSEAHTAACKVLPRSGVRAGFPFGSLARNLIVSHYQAIYFFSWIWSLPIHFVTALAAPVLCLPRSLVGSFSRKGSSGLLMNVLSPESVSCNFFKRILWSG